MAENATAIGQLEIAIRYDALKQQQVESWPISTLSNVLRCLPIDYVKYVFALMYLGCKNDIPNSHYTSNSVSINLECLSKEVRQVICAYLNDIGAVYQPQI